MHISRVAILSFLLLIAAPATYAADHVVGGNGGWTNNGNYVTWAAGQTFRVGDNLIFNYGGTHSVDEVNQSDYNNCVTSSPINQYTGGQSTLPLNAVGTMYFLCPTFGHCRQGMRLTVNVVAASTTPGSPPPPTTTPLPPPTTPSPPSTTPSPPPTTPSPPSTTPGSPPSPTTTTPPPPNAATSIFSSTNLLMIVIASSLALATIMV